MKIDHRRISLKAVKALSRAEPDVIEMLRASENRCTGWRVAACILAALHVVIFVIDFGK